MQFNQIFTFIIVAVTVVSAAMVVISKNPITSALYLILNFFCLGGIYLTLNAQFIAMIHILVYAGAIMVLVLFVIMLLNLKDEKKLAEKFSFKTLISILIGIVFFGQLAYIFLFLSPSRANVLSANSTEIGIVEYLGKILYTHYVFPFEATSFILLSAIIGVIILAKKKNT